MIENKPGKIYELIPLASKEIGAVGKSGANVDQNYAFRKIDDIYNATQPAFSKVGIFPVPNILEVVEQVFETQSTYNGQTKTKRQFRIKVKVEYTIYASDGSSVVATVWGENIDSSDKALNKAMTAAYKYMLIQVFSIAIDGLDDADKTTPEIIDEITTTAKAKTDAKKEAQKSAPETDFTKYKMKIKTKNAADAGQSLAQIGTERVNQIYDHIDQKKVKSAVEAEFLVCAYKYLQSVGVFPPDLDVNQSIPT